MKELFATIATAFSNEFIDQKNVLGWSMASTAWFLSNVEDINNVLTALLTTMSILWVTLKIVLAIRGYYKEMK